MASKGPGEMLLINRLRSGVLGEDRTVYCMFWRAQMKRRWHGVLEMAQQSTAKENFLFEMCSWSLKVKWKRAGASCRFPSTKKTKSNSNIITQTVYHSWLIDFSARTCPITIHELPTDIGQRRTKGLMFQECEAARVISRQLEHDVVWRTFQSALETSPRRRAFASNFRMSITCHFFRPHCGCVEFGLTSKGNGSDNFTAWVSL